MADTTNYRYGVIRSLDEAREAAAEAEADGLLGWYPAACVVLARELKRWEEAHAAWLESQRTLGVATPPKLSDEQMREIARRVVGDDPTSQVTAIRVVQETLHALAHGVKEGGDAQR